LLTGMTGISLHMQWPQSHNNVQNVVHNLGTEKMLNKIHIA
jgi:hypothetical protein